MTRPLTPAERKRRYRRRRALGAVPALGGMVATVPLSKDMLDALEAGGIDPRDEVALMEMLDEVLF